MPTSQRKLESARANGAKSLGPKTAPGRLAITLNAVTDAHLMIVGGAAMDGPRHIWWNFVSSRQERIEQAKAEWSAGRFGKVPGDEIEFIPLPEK